MTQDENETRTRGGFVNIELDLDEDQIKRLVEFWAKDNLQPASLEQFEDTLTAGDSLETALYNGVVNDIVLRALTEIINRETADTDEKV